MKCKECGLEYEVTTTTSETGDISLRGIHDAGGVDCLARQLAAKSAECEKLREVCEFTLDWLSSFSMPPTSIFAEKQYAMQTLQAALSRAEGKE